MRAEGVNVVLRELRFDVLERARAYGLARAREEDRVRNLFAERPLLLIDQSYRARCLLCIQLRSLYRDDDEISAAYRVSNRHRRRALEIHDDERRPRRSTLN